MVTVLAFVTISEDAPDALAAYFSVTDPLLKRAGARVIKRFAVNDVVVGTNPSQTVVIVEYQSREAVDSVFKSPEYAAVKATRDRAFSTYAVTIVDDLSSPTSVEPIGRQLRLDPEGCEREESVLQQHALPPSPITEVPDRDSKRIIT